MGSVKKAFLTHFYAFLRVQYWMSSGITLHEQQALHCAVNQRADPTFGTFSALIPALTLTASLCARGSPSL